MGTSVTDGPTDRRTSSCHLHVFTYLIFFTPSTDLYWISTFPAPLRRSSSLNHVECPVKTMDCTRTMHQITKSPMRYYYRICTEGLHKARLQLSFPMAVCHERYNLVIMLPSLALQALRLSTSTLTVSGIRKGPLALSHTIRSTVSWQRWSYTSCNATTACGRPLSNILFVYPSTTERERGPKHNTKVTQLYHRTTTCGQSSHRLQGIPIVTELTTVVWTAAVDEVKESVRECCNPLSTRNVASRTALFPTGTRHTSDGRPHRLRILRNQPLIPKMAPRSQRPLPRLNVNLPPSCQCRHLVDVPRNFNCVLNLHPWTATAPWRRILRACFQWSTRFSQESMAPFPSLGYRCGNDNGSKNIARIPGTR